jgi:hypothetical protein
MSRILSRSARSYQPPARWPKKAHSSCVCRHPSQAPEANGVVKKTFAGVIQWQNAAFPRLTSWVRIPSPAFSAILAGRGFFVPSAASFRGYARLALGSADSCRAQLGYQPTNRRPPNRPATATRRSLAFPLPEPLRRPRLPRNDGKKGTRWTGGRPGRGHGSGSSHRSSTETCSGA